MTKRRTFTQHYTHGARNSPGFVSDHIRYKQGQEQTPEVKKRIAAMTVALRRDRLKKQFGRDWRDTFYKGAKTHEQKAFRNSNMPLGTGWRWNPKKQGWRQTNRDGGKTFQYPSR